MCSKLDTSCCPSSRSQGVSSVAAGSTACGPKDECLGHRESSRIGSVTASQRRPHFGCLLGSAPSYSRSSPGTDHRCAVFEQRPLRRRNEDAVESKITCGSIRINEQGKSLEGKRLSPVTQLARVILCLIERMGVWSIGLGGRASRIAVIIERQTTRPANSALRFADLKGCCAMYVFDMELRNGR